MVAGVDRGMEGPELLLLQYRTAWEGRAGNLEGNACFVVGDRNEAMKRVLNMADKLMSRRAITVGLASKLKFLVF